jgi:sulfur carrier protein ThiS
MKIEIVLYAQLACLIPGDSSGNSCVMDVEDGCTIRDVLVSLTIPPESPKILFVNGRHAKEDALLKEGDRLAVFPPIAGG